MQGLRSCKKVRKSGKNIHKNCTKGVDLQEIRIAQEIEIKFIEVVFQFSGNYGIINIIKKQ